MESGSRFRAPLGGWTGRVIDALANCTGFRTARRAILGRLPFPVLASDVRHVVYCNWVVPVSRVAHLVPGDLKIWERDGQTILTILTYRHGHFGPVLAGPLRRLFPSPLQSNWRLYLDPASGPETGVRTVLFIRNIFDTLLHALGTRLFSDVLPSHWAKLFRHESVDEATFTQIGGAGSAPALCVETIVHDEHRLPASFAALFPDWLTALDFLCGQDAAVTDMGDCPAIAYSRIDLPIDVTTAESLYVTRFEPTPLLRDLGVDTPPFCFRVASVHFRVLSETVLRQRHLTEY